MARYLDIGPDTRPGWFKRRGMKRFETLDAVAAQGIDHVCDCRKLPFPDHTFEVVQGVHKVCSNEKARTRRAGYLQRAGISRLG